MHKRLYVLRVGALEAMPISDRFYYPCLDAAGQLIPVAAAVPLAQAPTAGLQAVELQHGRFCQPRFAILLRCVAPIGPLAGVGPGAILAALRDHVVSMWLADLKYFAASIHTANAYHGHFGIAPGAPATPIYIGFVEVSKPTDVADAEVVHHGGPRGRQRATRIDLSGTDFGPGSALRVLRVAKAGRGRPGAGCYLGFAELVRLALGGGVVLANVTYSTDAQLPLTPAAAGGPEAPQPVDHMHTDLDAVVEEARRLVYVTDPAAEPDFDSWAAPGEMYLSSRLPTWWIANNGKWRTLYRRWHADAQPGAGPLEPPEWQDFALTPQAYQWLCFREVHDRRPVHRRILLFVGTFSIGKSTLLQQLSMPEHAAMHGREFRGFLKIRAPTSEKFMDNLVNFLSRGPRREVLVINMEKAEAGRLSCEVADRIASLSDTYEPEYSGKYVGGEVRLSQHLVIFCNPPYEALLQGIIHKEVWLAHLGPNALRDEVVWHFPGQPPSVQPFGGRCGFVARPPPPGSPAAAWLDAWRAASLPRADTLAAVAAAAPSADVQAELGALSPEATAYLQHALLQHVDRGYRRCDQERAPLIHRPTPY